MSCTIKLKQTHVTIRNGVVTKYYLQKLLSLNIKINEHQENVTLNKFVHAFSTKGH